MDRRSFLKQTSSAFTGFVLGSTLLNASNFTRVLGANERPVVAVAGTHNRGTVLAQAFAKQGAQIKYICDVDKQVVEKTVNLLKQQNDQKPKGITDFRKALDDTEVDILIIATPDHWHAPMAILALQAGKHVYVEKPCSHNPLEGELLVSAQKKYRRLVQMGNQQRSSQETQEIIKEIHNGLIGKVYLGRAWYANKRGPIGFGKPTAPPDWLNFDLWQGPAPRRSYKDNLIHYNWHWFWHWGTGEICNNGTHEIDICRWALQVDFPVRVTSGGGRFHFNDDWEAFDTQNVTFEFPEDKMITWEGRSCNPFPIKDRGRGVTIHGEKGTVLIDRNGYIVYDMDNQIVKEVNINQRNETLNTAGGGSLTDLHIQNFLNAIRLSSEPHSPIDEGHISTLLCHLGNIAQRVNRSLQCDPGNGHIKNDDAAMQLWSREYQPGWEPKV